VQEDSNNINERAMIKSETVGMIRTAKQLVEISDAAVILNGA
jgi:hypothetical protein